MHQRARQSGFTLLEVMIAMSILAVGATSILAIFVAALSFQTQRVEDNRITELYNFAREHAQISFNAWDPAQEAGDKTKKKGPKEIKADLTTYETAQESQDPLVMHAFEKYPGFKYEVRWTPYDLAVGDSSWVAHITIIRLSGQPDESVHWTKEVLTRSGVPVGEFFSSPVLERLTKDDLREKRTGN